MEIINGIIDFFIKNPKFLFYIIILGALSGLADILYPKFRGLMGEFWLNLELNKLDKNKYKVLNDIMIRDEYGTHQIDHIVITSSYIFVIEMKNYYGFITGKEYNDKWCQHFGRRKYYFINPIHQNYGHIKSLSNVLNLDSSKFIFIICCVPSVGVH